MRKSEIAFCDIVVGGVGTGKTTFLHKEVLIPMLNKGHRALIVTEQRDDWAEYPLLSNYEEMRDFTGCRKMYFADGRLEKIREHYLNGVLIFDDARTYIQAQSTQFMQWLMISRRHEGIDLFSVFHGLDQVPPIYFKYSSRLILFHSTGEINKRKSEISDEKLTLIAEAKKQVETEVRAGNRYAKRGVVLDDRFNL
jgi:hypothetical protein